MDISDHRVLLHESMLSHADHGGPSIRGIARSYTSMPDYGRSLYMLVCVCFSNHMISSIGVNESNYNRAKLMIIDYARPWLKARLGSPDFADYLIMGPFNRIIMEQNPHDPLGFFRVRHWTRNPPDLSRMHVK